MLDFVINNIQILAQCGLFSAKEFELVSRIYKAFLFSTPAIVLALCTVDIAKAVMAQDDNAMKKAQGRALKRLIAGVVVFFIPVILNLILGMNYTDDDGNPINLGKECVTDVQKS